MKTSQSVKFILFILQICFFHIFVNISSVYSQNSDTEITDTLMFAEQMPSFPGGIDSLHVFLKKNIVYPATWAAKGANGRVFVRLLVNKEGKIFNPGIMRGIDNESDAEALRAVGLMPDWIPGMQNGKPVNVIYILQIPFLTDKPVLKPDKDMEEILMYSEVMPEFPGGAEGLLKYLKSNVRFPKEAAKQGISGRVVLRFVVQKDGGIGTIKVIRSLGSGCDEEAIRAVENMPKWSPGRNNGVPCNVYFTLPIFFTLQ